MRKQFGHRRGSRRITLIAAVAGMVAAAITSSSATPTSADAEPELNVPAPAAGWTGRGPLHERYWHS